MRDLLVRCLGLTFVVCAASHGALVTPRPRNSFDYQLANATRTQCVNLTGDQCLNGQAAFWYSQGCFIGCQSCDHVSGRRQTDLCGAGEVATNNEPLTRSCNRDAEAMSKFDIYRHNPWRWPGKAPVADACGLAGGTPWGSPAPEEGVYVNNSVAQHGMKGSQLPPLDSGVVWRSGGEVEVAWQVWANHGGGYQYRLCPASAPLTEACFQKMPLDFVRGKKAILRTNGTRVSVSGTYVDQGTVPAGSTWSLITLPPAGFGHRCACDLTSDAEGDKPRDYDCGCLKGEEALSCNTPGNCSSGVCLPCPETPGSDCSRCDNHQGGPSFPEPCEHCFGGAMLDVIKVPMVPPGKYVLGWRWDCEASSQVWSSCADITVVAAGDAPEMAI